MIFNLGPISFNTNVPDGTGSYWYVQDMQGWESPAYRISRMEPDDRDYEIIAESLLGARTITLEGLVKAPSEAALWSAWNYLSGVLPDFPLIDLTVGEVPPKSMKVMRFQPPKMKIIGVGAFEFQISMLAPKPLKVGGISAPRVIAGGA